MVLSTLHRLLPLVLAVFSIFSIALVASAESSQQAANSKEKIKLTTLQRKVYDYSVLQFDMLQSRRQLELTDSLRSELVFTLERLVEVTCMPELATVYEYTGPAEGKECLKYLKELEFLNEDNPVALCARHGISSESCVEAYDVQYITRYFSDPGSEPIPDTIELSSRLMVPSDEEYRQKKSIFNLKEIFNKKPTLQNKKELVKAHVIEIRKKCNPIRQRLQFSEPDEAWRQDFSKKFGGKDDPLRELVQEYSGQGQKQRGRSSQREDVESQMMPLDMDKIESGDYAGLAKEEKKEEQEKLNTAWRLRLLSYECMTAINSALAVQSDLSTAICYRQGLYSPQCVEARHRSKAKLQRNGIGRGGKQGLDSNKNNSFISKF